MTPGVADIVHSATYAVNFHAARSGNSASKIAIDMVRLPQRTVTQRDPTDVRMLHGDARVASVD
jgi:hypothetical protein